MIYIEKYGYEYDSAWMQQWEWLCFILFYCTEILHITN